MDENKEKNILEFKPRVKPEKKLDNESTATEEKVRREMISYTKVIEFVLKCDENDVWISIESLSDNKLINYNLEIALQKDKARELCNKTCSAIDSILDIKNNKNIIINMMKSLKLKDKMLNIFLIEIRKYNQYYSHKDTIDTYLISEICVGDGMFYFEKNNESDKFIKYLKENIDELFDLGKDLYYLVEACSEESVDIIDFN